MLAFQKYCLLFFAWIITGSFIGVCGQKGVTVEASASVHKLMNNYIEKGKSKDLLKVWRIQIISTSDRREMETTLATFRSIYPSMVTDWMHVSPNYQVRTGFFESKNKLMPLLLEIKNTFPSATQVYGTISKKTLIGL